MVKFDVFCVGLPLSHPFTVIFLFQNPFSIPHDLLQVLGMQRRVRLNWGWSHLRNDLQDYREE